jgi:hypothetical protein
MNRKADRQIYYWINEQTDIPKQINRLTAKQQTDGLINKQTHREVRVMFNKHIFHLRFWRQKRVESFGGEKIFWREKKCFSSIFFFVSIHHFLTKEEKKLTD